MRASAYAAMHSSTTASAAAMPSSVRKMPTPFHMASAMRSRMANMGSPVRLARTARKRSSHCRSSSSRRSVPAKSRRRAVSAAPMPACLPKNTTSDTELPPRRFAPCTLMQLHSPAACRPSTAVAHVRKSTTSMPPIM